MWIAWLERTLARRRVESARVTMPTRLCVADEPEQIEDETRADHDERGHKLEPAEP
jgi:hypothetical protein